MFFRNGSSWPIFPASSFHIQLCYSRSITTCFSCGPFWKDKRPEADTKLAAAPYWNIDHEGKVCAGTMRVPSLSVASIPLWQQAFFQSEFTHPGGSRPLDQAERRNNRIVEESRGQERFPRSALIDTETVQEYLRKLEAERRCPIHLARSCSSGRGRAFAGKTVPCVSLRTNAPAWLCTKTYTDIDKHRGFGTFSLWKPLRSASCNSRNDNRLYGARTSMGWVSHATR